MSTLNAQVRALAIATFALAAWSQAASAALVTVTDPLGNSDFTVTYDDAQTGAFGTPFLSNNTIFFAPNDFFAESIDGGLNSISDSFVMRLDAINSSVTLDQFNLEEQGDYILNGAGAEVFASGELRAFNANDPGNTYIDQLETGPLNMQSPNFTPVDWVGTAAIGSADGFVGTNSVWVTIENFLFARTAAHGEYAYIEKKFEGVSIEVTAIPVPAALWLFGTALLTLVRRRR